MATPAKLIINMYDGASPSHRSRMILHVPAATTLIEANTLVALLAGISQLGVANVNLEISSDAGATVPAAVPDAFATAAFHTDLHFAVVGAPGSHLTVSIPGPIVGLTNGPNLSVPASELTGGGLLATFYSGLVTAGFQSVGGELAGAFLGGRLREKNRRR